MFSVVLNWIQFFNDNIDQTIEKILFLKNGLRILMDFLYLLRVTLTHALCFSHHEVSNCHFFIFRLMLATEHTVQTPAFNIMACISRHVFNSSPFTSPVWNPCAGLQMSGNQTPGGQTSGDQISSLQISGHQPLSLGFLISY